MGDYLKYIIKCRKEADKSLEIKIKKASQALGIEERELEKALFGYVKYWEWWPQDIKVMETEDYIVGASNVFEHDCKSVDISYILYMFLKRKDSDNVKKYKIYEVVVGHEKGTYAHSHFDPWEEIPGMREKTQVAIKKLGTNKVLVAYSDKSGKISEIFSREFDLDEVYNFGSGPYLFATKHCPGHELTIEEKWPSG